VFESAQARCAKPVFHSFLLAVRGTLRKTGVRGVSVVAEDAWDLAALQRERREAGGGPPAVPPSRAGPSAPVKVWHASGGSAGWWGWPSRARRPELADWGPCRPRPP